MRRREDGRKTFWIFISVILFFVLIILSGLLIMLEAELRFDLYYLKLASTKPYVETEEKPLVFREGSRSATYQIPFYKTYTYQEPKFTLWFHSDYFQSEEKRDEGALVKAVEDTVNITERHPGKPAQLTKDCDLIPAVSGNLIDSQRLLTDIRSQFPEKDVYELESYYEETDDLETEELKNLLKKLKESKITYTNGDEIRAEELEPEYIPGKGSISINAALAKEKAKDISLKYDTAGSKTIEFNSTLRSKVEITGGTWGNISDSLAEMEEAEAILTNLGVSENRIPVLKQSLPDEIPDTYIEVDKNNQHVFVYENGSLLMDSDCVTGRPDRATPTGIFYISECMTDKTLKGPGYSSFVRRWMRLNNNGVGLHDASWRSSFGGEIYKRDGSHGCINLPKDFAYALYDWVKEQPNRVCVLVF